MDTIFDQIYRKAAPYWATRNNDQHIPESHRYALLLLKACPSADEEVVLPAILLHDVGWMMVPEKKQKGAFGPEVRDAETQRFHEKESVRIAREILASLDYDEAKTSTILAVIDGHDTRVEPLSLEDKLVKDADKLWRFTPAGVQCSYEDFGFELENYLDWLNDRIEEWFWTTDAKQMALEALRRARKELLHTPYPAPQGFQVRKP